MNSASHRRRGTGCGGGAEAAASASASASAENEREKEGKGWRGDEMDEERGACDRASASLFPSRLFGSCLSCCSSSVFSSNSSAATSLSLWLSRCECQGSCSCLFSREYFAPYTCGAWITRPTPTDDRLSLEFPSRHWQRSRVLFASGEEGRGSGSPCISRVNLRGRQRGKLKPQQQQLP